MSRRSRWIWRDWAGMTAVALLIGATAPAIAILPPPDSEAGHYRNTTPRTELTGVHPELPEMTASRRGKTEDWGAANGLGATAEPPEGAPMPPRGVRGVPDTVTSPPWICTGDHPQAPPPRAGPVRC